MRFIRRHKPTGNYIEWSTLAVGCKGRLVNKCSPNQEWSQPMNKEEHRIFTRMRNAGVKRMDHGRTCEVELIIEEGS
jgi:hypothetical protein